MLDHYKQVSQKVMGCIGKMAAFSSSRGDTNDATQEGIEKAIDKAMELKTASAAEVEEATKLIAAQYRQLELLKRELEALDGTIRKL